MGPEPATVAVRVTGVPPWAVVGLTERLAVEGRMVTFWLREAEPAT
jgi:hypothetical protein